MADGTTTTGSRRAAAFFDLDRTVIRRSSALALAGGFRRRGVISRTQVAKAAAWQLLFAARGASPERVRRAAEGGLTILKGFTPTEMDELVREALEPTLRPLVYEDALELVEAHRKRGEPSFVVSATLQEIVEPLAVELGFEGAIGSLCEVVDGVYTGRTIRACHAAGKADAVRELAAREGFDLGRSTAYSDSHSDLPFLEAVGSPVAVNPDRALRREAQARGWLVLEFRRRRAPRRSLATPSISGRGSSARASEMTGRQARRQPNDS